MDDAYLEEFDQQDIERIEDDNEAPVGPDEAEEAVVTVRDVKPKKIVTKPRLKLDDKRLKGPRGLCVLESIFKDTTLRGPGYERRDLDTVMSLLEHWAHRLFPKMTFDDCLEKIEDLGHKRPVSSYVTLLRMGCADPPVENPDEVPVRSRSPSPEPTVDPFDQLLDRPPQSQLTEEQRERMERNKLVALERRRARLKAMYEKANNPVETSDSVDIAAEFGSALLQSDDTTVTFDNDKLSDSTSRLNTSADVNNLTDKNDVNISVNTEKMLIDEINGENSGSETCSLVITENSVTNENTSDHTVHVNDEKVVSS